MIRKKSYILQGYVYFELRKALMYEFHYDYIKN